jgi:hypothetical protein
VRDPPRGAPTVDVPRGPDPEGSRDMIVYPPDQVAGVADAGARRILTGRGLPEEALPGFRAAARLCRYGRTGYLELGTEAGGDAHILLAPATGAVLLGSRWVADISPVNESLCAYVESQDLLARAAPFYHRDADFEDLEAVAGRLRDALAAIDATSVADPDGYWQSFIWDVAQGDYPQDVTG